MDEQSAIRQMKQGDISGLEELINLYGTRALETSYLITHDYNLSQDIVQTAFIRSYERISQFDVTRSFGPWFLRSVINDTLRACSRQRQVSMEVLTPEALETLATKKDALYDELEAAETKEAIWATLARLSPAQRAAIVLRYYLDLSEIEMSQVLNCPPGTVKRRLHDARIRLRHLLPKWITISK